MSASRSSRSNRTRGDLPVGMPPDVGHGFHLQERLSIKIVVTDEVAAVERALWTTTGSAARLCRSSSPDTVHRPAAENPSARQSARTRR
jgi:hypothetical protein